MTYLIAGLVFCAATLLFLYALMTVAKRSDEAAERQAAALRDSDKRRTAQARYFAERERKLREEQADE